MASKLDITNYRVGVKCKYCGNTHALDKSTIENEVKRMRIANFEIMVCPNCNNKYTLHDFEIALKIETEPVYEIDDPVKNNVVQILSSDGKDAGIKKLDTIREEQLNRFDISEETKNAMREKWRGQDEKVAKFVEEKKKMQEGLPFDKEIVGDVDMEDGTPGDKCCVVVLKKEAALYAKTYLTLQYIVNIAIVLITIIFGFLPVIFKFIIDILRKINWCIACSIVRIIYFVGYIVIVIYSVIALFIFNKPLFESFFLSATPLRGMTPTTNYILWDFLMLSLLVFPIMIQYFWLSNARGKWAKVISKHMNEITKK